MARASATVIPARRFPIPWSVTTQPVVGVGVGGAGAVLANSVCCVVTVLEDVVIGVLSAVRSSLFAHAASAMAKDRATDGRVKFINCGLEWRNEKLTFA